MNKFALKYLLLFFILLSATSEFSQTACAINKYQKNQQALNKVNKQIDKLRTDLHAARAKKLATNHQLKTTELKIADVSKKLHKLNIQYKKQNTSLHKLKTKLNSTLNHLQEQDSALSRQIQAAYILAQQDYLKILLKQQKPAEVTLLMNYYHYFNQARIKLIAQMKHELAKLLQMKKQIIKQTALLKNIILTRRHEKIKLKQNENLRKKIISQLNARINTKDKYLSSLISDRQALAHILSRLRLSRQTHKNFPKSIKGGSFAKDYGKLPWPTQGKIIVHFGHQVADSAIEINGVLIAASAGQNVYAIYPGRVVFAGWLRGFGLLMIVNHGNGYMSLYGRNESLYRSVGELVHAGDLIAKVGKSGGYEQSGLYFAIRHDGKPSDPEHWCRSV